MRYSIMAFKYVFNDLLKMVQQHVSNDNSMIVMINSGSKGSMLKYAQQTACIGLQLLASKFPFMIPSQLSCIGWNNQKLSDCEVIESTNANLGGQNLYAVIRNPLIEGLNPLECLLHAISGRANFFSENAAVPGTLTRKLMYHLRDLHVAYDGTVRSSFGQQIMQFSYDSADEMYCDRGLVGELGAPVGSWAACSISEAAYGALEQPVNCLEDSPLMNLQVNCIPLLGVYYSYMSLSSHSLIHTIYLICFTLLCRKYLSVTRLQILKIMLVCFSCPGT
jgi:DNA-directed RNA polymerase IV subunit 1